ncbi:MAG: hypothetical protein IT308_00030 [Anaerolineaceae bacterium]|nr:hypothetical protein [Anaerolineaceae bacterium]
MRTVRRVYFYLLALIGSQAMLWGGIHLLRTLMDEGLRGTVGSLATGLALVIVGLPVFLLHWLTAQRDARSNEEEGGSRIRAIFLYTVRVWTLISILFSLMALVNRLLAGFMNLAETGILFGGDQTAGDNLISIAANLILFAYFDRILRSDWRIAPSGHFLGEARRLYRYLWTLFGLTVTIFGVQGILYFLFAPPEKTGAVSSYRLANSLAMTLVNVPVWGTTWRMIQKMQGELKERISILRLVVLYLINLAGVVGVLAAGGRVLTSLFALLLGYRQIFSELMIEIAPALAVLIPLAVMWAYYWRVLNPEMSGVDGLPQRTGVRRLYYALLSALGLAVTFTGVLALFAYLSSAIFAAPGMMLDWGQINSGLVALTIGLPLWLPAWIHLKNEVQEEGEKSSRARRALARRAYLYLAVFLFVVGLMVAAGDLLYNLVSSLLGSPPPEIGRLVAMRLFTLTALTVFLIYHQRVLQEDGRAAQQALSDLHAAFPTMLIVPEEEIPLADEIVRALKRQAASLPVTIYKLMEGFPDNHMLASRLIVLPSGIAFDPPGELRGWLEAYQGLRLVLPQNVKGWHWVGVIPRPINEVAEETAASIRQMAEGGAPRGGLPSNPWSAAGCVLGGLFALLILISLFGVLTSNLFP